MFATWRSPLSWVAVTWSRTETGSHFSSTIYPAVLVMVEGGIGSHFADSAQLSTGFHLQRLCFPFPFSFLPSTFGSCGQSMCLPYLPTHASLSCPLEVCFMEVFAASGVLASLKIKLAWGGTETHKPSRAFVC